MSMLLENRVTWSNNNIIWFILVANNFKSSTKNRSEVWQSIYTKDENQYWETVTLEDSAQVLY